MSSTPVDSSMYYCYTCSERVQITTEEIVCPRCQTGFVEQASTRETLESMDSNQFEVGTEEGVNDAASRNLLNTMVEASLRNAVHMGGMGMNPGRSVFTFSFGQPHSADPESRRGPLFSTLNSSSVDQTRGDSSTADNPRPAEVDLIQDVIQRVLGGLDGSFVDSPPGGSVSAGPWGFTEIHGNAQDYAWGPNGLDNIISQLLGQLENVGPPPTSRQAINNLPKLTITQENVDAGCDCSVCMDSFNVDDDAKKLPCGHFFHIPCIEPWLELHNTCPICRKLVEDQSSSCDPEQAAPPPPPPYQFTTSSSPPAESSTTQPSTSRAAGSSGGGGGFFADLFLPFFGMPSRPRSGSGSDAPPRGGGDDHDDDHTYAS